jgi:hypothetical protein
VTLDCPDGYSPDALWRALGSGSGVADSKRVLSHRSMGPGEESALAIIAMATPSGQVPRTRHDPHLGHLRPHHGLERLKLTEKSRS